MKRTLIADSDLRGVIAVPPLPRQPEASRAIDFNEAEKLLQHIAAAGITTFMFGGNAFFHHITLREFTAVLDWMQSLPDEWWLLPAVGPSFGRLMDQAEILRGRGFPAVMMLPCSDPRDVMGLETGIREFANASATSVVVYLKSEDTLGSNPQAGIEAIGRLFDEGVCVSIKYAIVRTDPANDPYLDRLLHRVRRERIVSGIGERPAVIHMEQWRLPGFTTGSGCIAPRLTRAILAACQKSSWDEAGEIRERFLPLEDCRDAWNPAKVLHHAVDLAGIARTGPVPPFLSALGPEQLSRVKQALSPLLRERA
jgi:dihydrodipicolinate synthase/N-acetylneuraminate lyase